MALMIMNSHICGLTVKKTSHPHVMMQKNMINMSTECQYYVEHKDKKDKQTNKHQIKNYFISHITVDNQLMRKQKYHYIT